MIVNIWEKVVKYTEEKLGLNIDKADMRFMYVVYWFMIHDKNVVLRTTLKRIHKNYLEQFGSIDKQSFVAFERSVYRVYNRLNEDVEVSFIDFVGGIVDKI